MFQNNFYPLFLIYTYIFLRMFLYIEKLIF